MVPVGQDLRGETNSGSFSSHNLKVCGVLWQSQQVSVNGFTLPPSGKYNKQHLLIERYIIVKN